MMMDFTKNDDAVSVVVGAILLLSILVTFMSVVTSSWVPIYEGNAESDHGDDLFEAFLDFRKQIENADEFPRISTIDLGTDDMPFMKNTNSVGRLELNESAGAMTLTSVIYSSVTGSDVGDSLIINDLNTGEESPIQNFTFDLILNSISDFDIELNSKPPTKLEIEIEDGELENTIEITIKYNGNPVEKWGNYSIPLGTTGIIYNDTNPLAPSLFVDMLSPDILLELDADGSNLVTIGTGNYSEGNLCPLNELIQHYLKLSPEDYDFTYKDDDGISDGVQTLLYNTTIGTLGGTRPKLELTTIGGGILTMESDYNFMVDQSYIYDNGAVILKQEDGLIFKVDPPIFYDKNNVTGDLKISFQTVILTGDYMVSGNGLETINVVLPTLEYNAGGITEAIAITKDTTPELYGLWHSYFSDMMDFVNNDTNADCYDMSNGINQVGVKINNTPSILLTVQTKEIEIS